MKILIVENSLRVRRMIRNLLCGVVSEVFECADGALALAAYQAHRPDWVLMDIGLKDVDGIAATGRIKADFPEARVVIVTDYDDDGLRRAAQQAGACAYVLKETLFELRTLISGGSSQQSENDPDSVGKIISKTSLTLDLRKEER